MISRQRVNIYPGTFLNTGSVDEQAIGLDHLMTQRCENGEDGQFGINSGRGMLKKSCMPP